MINLRLQCNTTSRPASVINTKKGRAGATFDASEATFASACRTERAITRTASV